MLCRKFELIPIKIGFFMNFKSVLLRRNSGVHSDTNTISSYHNHNCITCTCTIVCSVGTWKQQYYILPVTGNQSLQLILNAPPTSGRGHTNCATSFLPLLPSNTLTSNDVTLFNKDSNWIQTLHTNGPNG